MTSSNQENQMQDIELGEQQKPVAPIESQQPSGNQAMDPQRPHDETEMRLRGGEGQGMCPGRFCFIIPCPIPCNFCVFPCPC